MDGRGEKVEAVLHGGDLLVPVRMPTPLQGSSLLYPRLRDVQQASQCCPPTTVGIYRLAKRFNVCNAHGSSKVIIDPALAATPLAPSFLCHSRVFPALRFTTTPSSSNAPRRRYAVLTCCIVNPLRSSESATCGVVIDLCEECVVGRIARFGESRRDMSDKKPSYETQKVSWLSDGDKPAAAESQLSVKCGVAVNNMH